MVELGCIRSGAAPGFHFQDADKAREYLEALRWPHGPVCPHCGSISRKHLSLKGSQYRPGLFKCADCYEQFTVTVGTVFERSKVPLNLWLQAVHLMAASKKGISAKHLQRYCNEFDFRWNTRQSQGWNDSDRADAALLGIAGKRLTYRRIGGESQANA